MPIEIKELHIRAIVQDDANNSNNTTTAVSQNQVNSIVAECVEQVLTIIKEKEER
jgi:Family of unknown function (DUF5908)